MRWLCAAWGQVSIVYSFGCGGGGGGVVRFRCCVVVGRLYVCIHAFIASTHTHTYTHTHAHTQVKMLLQQHKQMADMFKKMSKSGMTRVRSSSVTMPKKSRTSRAEDTHVYWILGVGAPSS
jgi:hypothetical protein